MVFNKAMKKIIQISILAALYSSNSIACSLVGEPTITWTAFKTPKKVGVPGTFTSVTRKGENKADTLSSLLESQMVTIDSTEISTKNSARDKKIVKFFFGALAEKKFTANFKKASKKSVTMELNFNKIKKDIPLEVGVKGNELTLSGHLDILDFELMDGLAAINKACYALHEGKTWSHVLLTVKQKVKGCNN